MRVFLSRITGLCFFLKEFFLPTGFGLPRHETEPQEVVKCLKELREQLRQDPAMQDAINEIVEEISDPSHLLLVDKPSLKEKFLSAWDAARSHGNNYLKPKWQIASGYLEDLNAM